METAVRFFVIFGAFSGLSEEAGVLPDVLDAAIGGSVLITTTMPPSETPFALVTWTFELNTIGISTPFGETITEEYRDRARIFHSTGSLELRNLSAADSGEYGVNIIPETGPTVLGTTTLRVHGLSERAGVLPDVLDAAIGDSVLITTTMPPSETPFAVVTWTFELNTIGVSTPSGETIPEEYRGRVRIFHSTGSLELRNLSAADSGDYGVTIIHVTGPTVLGTTTLRVHAPVSNVTIDPETVNLVEFNDTLELSCNSSGSPLSFLWIKDGSDVTASDRVQITDGGKMLTIVNVIRGDQGMYTCKVSNPASSATSDPATVTVSYGPEKVTLTPSPAVTDHAAGSDITMVCSAESRPAAQFTWFLNGAQQLDTGSELKLMDVKVDQSGSYSCQAFNPETLRYQSSEPSVINIQGESSGCGAGCIAGIVIACIVLVAALVGGGYFIYRRKGNTEAKPKVDVDVAVDERQENYYENISAVYDKDL